jgi:hypothetical protein
LIFDRNYGSGVVAYGRSDYICFMAGRTLQVSSIASYVFTVGGDDGVRLYVDDQLVVNGWAIQPYKTYPSSPIQLTAGDHKLRLEYFEKTDDAQVSFSMTAVTPTPSPSYPSDTWERIWYVYSGNPSSPWGTSLGSGPHQSSLVFNDNWGTGTLAYGKADLVGFISSRTVNIASGTWTFTVGGDDGVRLYIDDSLVINSGWKDQAYTTYTYTTSFASTANHRLRLEYYESMYGAVVSFGLSQAGAVTGLKGEYYTSASTGDFTSKVMERIDSTVFFDWGSVSLDPRVPSDLFAVRWTGSLATSTSGAYTIWVTTDDGVRVWIDGSLVIDAWRIQAPTEYKWAGTLSAGQHPVKIEYYEDTGGAAIKLGWTPPGGGKTYPIPSSNLSPS